MPYAGSEHSPNKTASYGRHVVGNFCKFHCICIKESTLDAGFLCSVFPACIAYEEGQRCERAVVNVNGRGGHADIAVCSFAYVCVGVGGE